MISSPNERVRAGNLFERVPEKVFWPLATNNHRRMWDLLVQLYDDFFGPDVHDGSDGHGHETVTAAIGQFIQGHGDWVREDGSKLDTPINIQANQELARLLECGWLVETRVHLRSRITMTSRVRRFLELLREYAEDGPATVGGKVTIVYQQLRRTVDHPAENAAAFREASRQARDLINLFNDTAVRATELIGELSQYAETSAFIAGFFEQYIEKLFIADYHELRTTNHPLRYRAEIVDLALQLRDDPLKREPVVRWYREALKYTSDAEASYHFERDLKWYIRFDSIERQLMRLEVGVDAATRKAISYIQYRVRTRDQIGGRISAAIEWAIEADARGLPTALPVMPVHLAHEASLKLPATRAAEQARLPLSRPQMSMQGQALRALRARMLANRDVSPERLIDFLARQMGARRRITSDELELLTVHDLCAVATLARFAANVSSLSASRISHHNLLRLTKAYTVELEHATTRALTKTPLIEFPRFAVERREAPHAR